MNQDNATRAAGSSALDCWPTFSEYGGGGTILTRTTGQSGFDDECRRHRVDAAQVRKLIADGNEVLILAGEIKAVQRDGWANNNLKVGSEPYLPNAGSALDSGRANE